MERMKKRVAAERSKSYGDSSEGHANLGLLWTGILQNHYGIKLEHPLPADVVLVMMAASKANRAVRTPDCMDDNYIDGALYFELAHVARKGRR